MPRSLLTLALLPLLAGCATTPWDGYWQKPTKYKEMPEKGSTQDVATLSLDASRRLVIAHDQLSTRFTCPEPPPDVSMNTLDQVIATLQTKDGSGASYGASAQAISQVLSNRTALVEVWRTTSSMYCVLLMNKQPGHAESYLAAAGTAMSKLSDSAHASTAAASFIDGLNAHDRLMAAAKQREEQAVAAAKQKEELEKARKECEAVPAEQKATHASCVKAKAGA